MRSMSAHLLHAPVMEWFGEHARVLPWRRPDAGGWPVLVSEVMLQQTPVARVLPVFEEWLSRWPRPADLAADSPGEAVRMWGRLGYPRRALRLHSAAVACVERHGGQVPAGYDELRDLPGVGDYTAAAVASFAFRQRHAVLDTNVRRVLARLVGGHEYESAGSPTAAERHRAELLLPDDPDSAATWAVAVMELGALVCTARSPRCADCPVAEQCRWLLAGKPPWDGPPRRGQTYAGTDRAVRGLLLAPLRTEDGPVTRAVLESVWADAGQRERCLDSLVSDGLVEPHPDGTFTLPR
jgi:A/G-specific adenine glycosylase